MRTLRGHGKDLNLTLGETGVITEFKQKNDMIGPAFKVTLR